MKVAADAAIHDQEVSRHLKECDHCRILLREFLKAGMNERPGMKKPDHAA